MLKAKRSLRVKYALPVLFFSLAVGYVVVGIFAAGPAASFLLKHGVLSGNATVVANSSAIGGSMVRFGGGATATPTPAATPAPTPAPTFTPTTGSAKRSNFPERFSVGAPGVAPYSQSQQSLPVPAGYTVLNPHDNNTKVYNIYTCGNVHLDRVYIKAFIYLGTGCYGTVTITNSIIAPPPGSDNRAILNNSNGNSPLTINISNTTIRPEPVPMGGKNDALTDHVLNDSPGSTIIMDRVDVANSGGMCLCGANVTITNSWLHDSYIAHLPDPGVAHTGGVFPYGGSGPLTIRNNRLEPGTNAATGQAVPNYWQAITAVLFTQGSSLRNYIVENNFISMGAYDMQLQDGQGMIVRNNIFGPNHWGHAACSNGCNISFADWSGNVTGDIAGNPTSTAVPRPQ